MTRHLPIPLYVPNILCYIRILLSFLSISTASHVSSSDDPFRLICVTSGLWIIASILDHIDGKVARYFNQCSHFGVLLDIIADNILRGSAWMCAALASASTTTSQNDATSCGDGTAVGTTVGAAVGVSDNSGGVTSTNLMTSITPMMGLFLISVEWITMISSQMLTLLKEKRHWKHVGQSHHKLLREQENQELGTKSCSDSDNIEERASLSNTTENQLTSTQPPRFVQAVFANNFCNVFGVLAMYGLFSIGMIQFLCIHQCTIFEFVPILRIPLYFALITSYIGRLLALCTEMWLCSEFVKYILDEEKTKKNFA